MIKGRWEIGSAATVPARLDKATREHLRGTANKTAIAIGIASRSQQIAAATRVAQLTGRQAVILIGAGVPFARIRDQGGVILASRDSVLVFADGGYSVRAFQRGIGYIEKGGQAFGPIVNEEFHGEFSVLR